MCLFTDVLIEIKVYVALLCCRSRFFLCRLYRLVLYDVEVYGLRLAGLACTVVARTERSVV